MELLDSVKLEALIRENDWIIGAVNYDEDLHFSSYYLRSSCPSITKDIYPGYSCQLAFYEDFTERYYLLKDECTANAVAITEKALNHPLWLATTLREIVRQSDMLATIFDSETSVTSLAGLSDAALVDLYRKHDLQNRELYKWARIPEALDRGVSYFTNYLKQFLRQIGLDEDQAENAFITLTQPVTPSVLAQELLEFERIVDKARRCESSVRPANFTRRARMLLPSAVVSELTAHAESWKYLEYHGYGKRELTPTERYIERLATRLSEPDGYCKIRDLRQRLEQNKAARDYLFKKLSLDPAHRLLFEAYPEIGATKLYRRHAQLRNFYFLDLLLSDIARRVDVDEWTLRCMLPEELVSSLENRSVIDSGIQLRKHGCIFFMMDGREYVIGGKEISKLRKIIDSKARIGRDRKVLKGFVASKGRTVGTCKIMIRSDKKDQKFKKGNILVSESTDPDLLKYLNIAGAVLTEQGGVTSHAAIICRELEIPTIIGIDGLLERLKDGDVVEVDANVGSVRLLRADTEPPEDLVVDREYESTLSIVGGKARNLNILRAMGYRVPEYIVLSFQRVQDLISKNSEEPFDALRDWLRYRLLLESEDKLAIRSSATSEDNDAESKAGEFHSLLHVDLWDLSKSLREFVAANKYGKRDTPYEGGIIVQKMVYPDVAGVCLTIDSIGGRADSLTVEYSKRGNEEITAGTSSPQRIIINRLTGDIIESNSIVHDDDNFVLEISEIVRQFLELEIRLQKPLDIEWAFSKGLLYFLQVRSLVQTGIKMRLAS